MTLPTLDHKSDRQLIIDLKVLVRREREDIADVVLHLAAFDSRALYSDFGYSSLYAYCTTELQYSGSSAQRRIQAARALVSNPELYERLREGRITLCAIAELKYVKDQETKTQLIVESEGKSSKEVEKLVVKAVGPIEKPKKERVVPHKIEVAPSLFNPEPEVKESYSISMEFSKEDMELFNEVKNLIGPCSMAEVFIRVMKEFLKRRNTVSRITSAAEVKSKTVDENSRYIRKATRILVRQRDNNQCTHVTSDGRRCTEKCGLQFDHIQPFARGGNNSPENLRLHCPAHNQLAAERVFGREFIKSKIK